MRVLLLLWLLPVQAAEIFKSVDEQGQIIFSDQPPKNAQPIELIKIKPPSRPVDPVEKQKEIDRIQQKADQMEKARLEREALRLKQAEQKKAEQIEEQKTMIEKHYIHPVPVRPVLPHPPIYPVPEPFPSPIQGDHPTYRPQ